MSHAQYSNVRDPGSDWTVTCTCGWRAHHLSCAEADATHAEHVHIETERAKGE